MRFRFLHERWFHILVFGIILFFVAEQLLRRTGNLALTPAVIVLGAFVVPASFVAYFYSQERQADRKLHRTSPMGLLLDCFLIGGALGTLIAGTIESATLHGLTVSGLLEVGLVEESVKLIVPVIIFAQWRYRSEADGLLFGVAAGMGFAALETAGYGFSALIASRGDIGQAEQVLLIRGLLSPFGHAAWTGLVCAALWRGRMQTGRAITGGAVLTFILVIMLHALWDIGSALNNAFITYAAYIIVGGTSLSLLVREIRRIRRTRPVDVIDTLPRT